MICFVLFESNLALENSSDFTCLIVCHLLCLQIRVQAIRGFPLLGKDAEFVTKIADILGQLLICGMVFFIYLLTFHCKFVCASDFACVSEENVERDAVHKALMSLIRQDVKSTLPMLNVGFNILEVTQSICSLLELLADVVK
jgi:hypothetical protein